MKKYLPGAILPPHLSPFSSDYNTYEEQLKQLKLLSKGSFSRILLGKVPKNNFLDVLTKPLIFDVTKHQVVNPNFQHHQARLTE